jgi:peptide/nickel transport system substrate-binding protein
MSPLKILVSVLQNVLSSRKALAKVHAAVIIIIIVIAVGAAAFYYSSLSKPPAPPAIQYQRTLTIAIPQEPTSLDIQQTTDSDEVHNLIFQSTMSFTPDYVNNATLVPNLAFAQNYGSYIIVHFPDNAKFSNGDPITAQAFKASMLRYENLSEYGSDYAEVKSIDIIDNQTAKIVFTQPESYVWWNDIPVVYGDIVDVKVANQTGNAAFGENPIGSGPWMVQSWVRGSQVVLVKNPYYTSNLPFVNNTGPNPYLDQVIVRFIPDDATRLSEILSGDVDIVRQVPVDALAEVSNNPDIVMHESITPGVDYIMLNEKVPPLNDVRVRQALNYAVNRTELAQVLDNAVLPCYSYMSPTMLAYNASLESYAANLYAYNPEKAKSLLTDAGWTMGADGMFSKNGQPLSLTFMDANDIPDLNVVGPLLQAQFAKVGVQVKIQEFTGYYIRDQTSKWNFELAAREYSWHDPAGILPYLLGSTMGNYTYSNPQVDNLMGTDMAGDLAPAARVALYTQVQQIALNDAPWIPLFVEKNYVAVRKDVQGLVIIPPFNTVMILNDVKIPLASASQAVAPPLALLLAIVLFVNFGCIAARKRSKIQYDTVQHSRLQNG